MRVPALAATALIAVLLANPARAESILEFDLWMKRIEKRSLSVQRNLKSRDADAAIADASELRELYQQMEDYFTRRGDMTDAVTASREGGVLAGKVVEAASARDFDSALRSAIAVARDCRDCHLRHKPLED